AGGCGVLVCPGEGGHAGSGGSDAGVGSDGSPGFPGIGDGPRGPVSTCPPGEHGVLVTLVWRAEGDRWELLSIDPDTGVASSYPDPHTATVLTGLASTTGFPVFD